MVAGADWGMACWLLTLSPYMCDAPDVCVRVWCEATVGKDHPSYAGTVMGMANVYQEKSEYDRALEMYGEARAVYEVRGYVAEACTYVQRCAYWLFLACECVCSTG